MEIRKIILIYILLITNSISSQIKNDLKEYKIANKLNKYGIKLNNYSLKNEFGIKYYNEGFTVTNNKDSIVLKKIKIFDKSNFFLFTYKYTPTNYNKNHKEYFILNDNKFFIDTIIHRDKINLKYYNPYFYLRTSYFFKGKKKGENLIIIEAENRTFYRNNLL